MLISVKCFLCEKYVSKYPSQIREHNFCCRSCRLAWMSKNNVEVINVLGHNKGQKRPDVSERHRTQNRMNKKGGLTQKERDAKRRQGLEQQAKLDTGKSYRKYYGRHLHRVVMEMQIGRSLNSDEIVHHIDGNILNNVPDNLMIVTRQEHARIHFHNKNPFNEASN